ncbi:MAG: cell division ATP-binding protein FtsE, partial [Firmicutes bacterium]|nr:cell division ATP-binding protein FtsE [Bacillota bacterium]
MIDFINVTKSYDDKVVLQDANLHIDDGEFVFIVGPTGAGKSTLIKLISREVEPDEGDIIVDGQVIDDLSNREIPQFRRQIGMVFQDFRLLPNLTVYENVAFAKEVVHSSKRTIKRIVPQLLAMVDIEDLADKFPDQISGGEQQRVAIARAIANNPKYVIADEPTGNLDGETAWAIMDLLSQINRRGTTVVMVTHAADIVERMNKRVITIQGGRIISDR